MTEWSGHDLFPFRNFAQRAGNLIQRFPRPFPVVVPVCLVIDASTPYSRRERPEALESPVSPRHVFWRAVCELIRYSARFHSLLRPPSRVVTEQKLV